MVPRRNKMRMLYKSVNSRFPPFNGAVNWADSHCAGWRNRVGDIGKRITLNLVHWPPQPLTGKVTMTNTTPATFEATWKRYAVVHAQCETLSGKALSKAQDEERQAVLDLIDAPSRNLDDVALKLAALQDLMEMGRCSDNRDGRLLHSIMRDVFTLGRKAS